MCEVDGFTEIKETKPFLIIVIWMLLQGRIIAFYLLRARRHMYVTWRVYELDQFSKQQVGTKVCRVAGLGRCRDRVRSHTNMHVHTKTSNLDTAGLVVSSTATLCFLRHPLPFFSLYCFLY